MPKQTKPSIFRSLSHGSENSATPLLLPTVNISIKNLKYSRESQRFMNPGEIQVLIALLQLVSPLNSIIEIGVNEGYTAKAILDNIPEIKEYIGIDVTRYYQPSFESQRKEIPTKPGHVVVNHSNVHLYILPNGSFDYPFMNIVDAVFIDGDHGRKAVEHDTRMAIDCVRPGGIIIWHDYVKGRESDVPAVLEEYHKDRGYNIKHVENTWLAFLIVE